MPDSAATIVALDVGERRIGVAVAGQATRLANPLMTILNDDTILDTLTKLVNEQHASALVVGLPRGMSGQKTKQTEAIEAFVLQLRQHVDLPIYWQDEALTSHQAEKELESRGKPYSKGDVDALAACYILEDFLKDHFRSDR
jgi:putative Holliday junction resolvase